jgi:hypothetical protein
VIIEHILVHWDDIMDLLIDEIVQDEVLELNRLEERSCTKETTVPVLSSKTMVGKFHDYKDVDLREITTIFDEYRSAE